MAKQKSEPEKQTDPPRGYFLSLTLENVRCFGPKQTLDLSDGHGKPAPWTVVLGINGTGKTTLLKSLVGFEVTPSVQQDIYTRYFHQAMKFPAEEWDHYSRHEKNEAIINVTIAVSQNLMASPTTISESRVIINAAADRISHNADFLALPPWCCAYGAGRRLGAASFSTSSTDDPTASLFTDKADLRNPEEWLLQLDYAAIKGKPHIQEQQQARLEQVKALLLSIFPENEIDGIRFASSGGANPKACAEFKTPYGWVPLRQLGYGYQTLITWVTDLASRMVERYPDSPDPLAEPAFVAVDEIDLHLHPVWQRKLMDFLTKRFPNTQFVATAHSPLVAQAAANANLAVLRREGDHVVIDNNVENIKGWRIDQILTSDLFGLESARPPQIEGLIAERKKLITKPKQTAADKSRLAEIEAEIGDLPTGETAQEVKEREEIRKSLELLLKERHASR